MKKSSSDFFKRLVIAFGTENGAEIARQLGVERQTIYKWRDGQGLPTQKLLLKISQLTGKSTDWLLKWPIPENLSFKTVTTVSPASESEETTQKNTSNRKNKLLAPGVGAEDTVSDSLTNIITKYPTASFALVPVPLIGTISASSQQIVFRKEPLKVKVPSFLTSKDSILLQIEGEELSDEGLRDGDLVLGRPVDGSAEDKVVIAITNEKRVLVRHYHKAGRLVHFSALEGDSPVIRIPEKDVEIKWIVTSITRPFE